jgi:hypothetical protein
MNAKKNKMDRIKACEKKIAELKRELQNIKSQEASTDIKALEKYKKAVKDNASIMDALYSKCAKTDCEGLVCHSSECTLLLIDEKIESLS